MRRASSSLAEGGGCPPPAALRSSQNLKEPVRVAAAPRFERRLGVLQTQRIIFDRTDLSLGGRQHFQQGGAGAQPARPLGVVLVGDLAGDDGDRLRACLQLGGVCARTDQNQTRNIVL